MRLGASFEAQYAAAADQVLNGVGREAFNAMRTLMDGRPRAIPARERRSIPNGAFGQALRQIAQLTKAESALEVAFADIGGWDTHVNQGGAQGQLAARLDDFARSIAALVTDLGERMADTVVLTMSEFGRAVKRTATAAPTTATATPCWSSAAACAAETSTGVAWAGNGRAVRGARLASHHRLPRRVRRNRRAPYGAPEPPADFSGILDTAGEVPGRVQLERRAVSQPRSVRLQPDRLTSAS